MAQKSGQKLRIGVVGAGNIVRTRHLPALKKNPDVDIVAVRKDERVVTTSSWLEA